MTNGVNTGSDPLAHAGVLTFPLEPTPHVIRGVLQAGGAACLGGLAFLLGGMVCNSIA